VAQPCRGPAAANADGGEDAVWPALRVVGLEQTLIVSEYGASLLLWASEAVQATTTQEVRT
jgi:hypothetical protein